MTGFVLRVAIVALGLWLATLMLPGLHFVNAIVRPIAVVLTLPLTLLTLGLFLLVVNAAMLGLVALLLEGFRIDGGFWTALGGSLIVSITGWVASGLIGHNGKVEVMRSR
jgi:putative membrane protein